MRRKNLFSPHNALTWSRALKDFRFLCGSCHFPDEVALCRASAKLWRLREIAPATFRLLKFSKKSTQTSQRSSPIRIYFHLTQASRSSLYLHLRHHRHFLSSNVAFKPPNRSPKRQPKRNLLSASLASGLWSCETFKELDQLSKRERHSRYPPDTAILPRFT